MGQDATFLSHFNAHPHPAGRPTLPVTISPAPAAPLDGKEVAWPCPQRMWTLGPSSLPAEPSSGVGWAIDTHRLHRIVEAASPWAAGVLLAIPVLVAFYPPMTDLPFHEAGIAMLRHFDDASMFPAGLYTRNLGEPNQLFHLAGWGASFLVSTRWAVKLVVAATAVAIPVCAARFARHVGSSPLGALVVAPIALGWLFSWGLVANLIGLAALLACLPLLDALGRRPTLRTSVAALGAVPLLYLAHEAMLFAYAGAALLLAVLYRGSLREAAWRGVPFAGCLLVTAAELVWQHDRRTPTVRGIGATWDPVGHRLMDVPALLLPGDGLARASMALLCLTAIALLLWLRTRERHGSLDVAPPLAVSRWERARSWALSHRWELFAMAGFIAYLTFPTTLYGATYLHHRWFAPAFAVFAVVAGPRDLWTAPARVARACVFTLPVAPLLVGWPAFADSGREYASLDALLPSIAPGSAVAELELGPDDPSRSFKLGTASGRVLATRGGRIAYSFTDSPIFPVVIPKRYQWNEPAVRIAFDCWKFEPSHDLRRFRYVLVHAGDPALLWLATYVLQPEAVPIAERGEWVLYESKLALSPIVSADVPLDNPRAASFRDRMKEVTANLRSPAVLPR